MYRIGLGFDIHRTKERRRWSGPSTWTGSFTNGQLNISEVKDLTIVQIVQYKRSKVQLSSIQIDGLEFSLQSPKVSSNKETRILWSAPSTWLVISRRENIVKKIKI